jgi:hypothetical protein
MYDKEYFFASASGSLEKQSSLGSNGAGYYFLEYDDLSFVKYKFENNQWVAYYKNGVKYYYDNNNDSIIRKNSSDIFR